MALTRDQKAQMAARARTLQERLDEPPDPDESRDVSAARSDERGDSDDGDEWLQRWCEYLADGDDDAFAERLDIAGLSVEECRRRIDCEGWPASDPLPAWVERIDDVLDYVADADELPPIPDGTDETPFAHLLVGIVEYASKCVEWSATPDEITESAVEAFETWLLERLSALAAHTLFIEFKTFLANRDPELAFADDPAIPDPPDRHYEAFVEQMRRDGLIDVFVEYPVLAKLYDELIEMWVEAVEEFGNRLAADREAIVETFCPGEQLGALEEVEVLGDAHRGGRRVLGLTFGSGTRIAYKPRNVAIEATYSSLLEWVNENSSLPDLRTLERLPRDGHGWVEWVETEDCDSHADVATYYRRAGALICIMYALKFSDGNLENIVAAGDQPVVVDLETLLQPEISQKASPGPRDFKEVFDSTVLQSYLLPMYAPEADIKAISGFGSDEAEVSDIERPEFENVNTDAMEMEFVEGGTITGDNFPTVDGEQVEPEDHYEEIAAGFEETYRFLLDERETLLESGGLIDAFAETEVRYLYRPTRTYGKVLIPLETPSYLEDGRMFGCKVERLARLFVDGTTGQELWPLYEAEREALWRIDVPRFTVDATSTALSWNGEIVGHPFETSPVETVRERVRSLDSADLDTQLDYLELAYRPERYSHPEPPTTGSPPSDSPGRGTSSEAETSFEALAERAAKWVFERLRAHEARGADGEPLWRVREYRINGIYFPRVPENFYSGRPGIAVFAAALGETFDDDSYREYAAQVIQPSLDQLGDAEQFRNMKQGGTLGYGSLIYGYTKLWELLGDERYREAAIRSAELISTDWLGTDTHLDPHRGTSGLIVSLLALYEATRDGMVRDWAITAGDHLLAHKVGNVGTDAWRRVTESKRQRPVTHGPDALPLSLFRLADATGEERFREAAVAGVDYGVAAPDRQPCPDARIHDWDDVTPGWLAGRAGLGLSRLALYEASGDGDLRREAERALRTLETDSLARWDHLYAGNFGRVEFLRRASLTLDEPTYESEARRLARRTVERADAAGRFTVPWQTDDWYNPGFYSGETGIGYSLLSLLDPEIPDVLLWE